MDEAEKRSAAAVQEALGGYMGSLHVESGVYFIATWHAFQLVEQHALPDPGLDLRYPRR